MTEHIQLRRSQLVTPGSEPEMITNVRDLEADEVLLDLEDSVVPKEKQMARENIIEKLQNWDWSDTLTCVRINSVSTRWWYSDVIDVVGEVGGSVDSLLIPKSNNPRIVSTVDHLLSQVEVNNDLPQGEIGLQCQIETAEALNNVLDIAATSDRIESLVFGPGDYATSIDAPGPITHDGESNNIHHWHYQLTRIIHAAKAQDLQVIDGLYPNVKDEEGFRRTCEQASLIGCDGKWVIHPNQIKPANDVFAPSQEAIEKARDILATLDEVDKDSTAPFSNGGEVLDAATVKRAKHIVRAAERVDLL